MLHNTAAALATLLLSLASSALAADPILTSFSPSAIGEAAEVVILDYHSFLGSGSSSMDYSDEDLGSQLDRIESLGYRFVSLADAIAGKIAGKANISITIDDGNHSVYQAFRKIFEPRGIKPDLFIYPAVIGKDRHFLTPELLGELVAAGCGVGAHGFYHEFMTPKAYAKDPAKVLAEAERPGPALEKILGSRPLAFAYPFGVGSPQAKAALVAAGYSWAFLASDKVVPVRFSEPSLDHFAVPRTIVYRWNREQIMKTLAERIRP